MDLKTLKELEDIKEEIAPFLDAARKKKDDALTNFLDSAFGEFSAHFKAAGFAVSEQSRSVSADYKSINFSLVMSPDGSRPFAAYAVLLFNGSTLKGQTPTKIYVTRKGGPRVITQTLSKQLSQVEQARKDLQTARESANEPAPEFDLALAGANGSLQGAKLYSKMTDLLNAILS